MRFPNLRELLQRCCSADAAFRPSIAVIKSELERFKPTGNIVENLLQRLKRHADRLEETVRDRTAELLSERGKVDALISQFIPPSLVAVLRSKQAVHADLFEAVTIYFSSMIGFDDFCKECSPMTITAFLNALYIQMDKQMIYLGVYKVETVKDGYMVASGVPIRNGDQDVTGIARLALRVLENCAVQLKIRIGIHTGPVAAGIVGLKLPRYCLFGDTVNTASRMESHGEASKIHLSPETHQALLSKPGYLFESRGVINVKGKGVLETFWLLGLVESEPQHDRK